jgi:DnaJ-class molecular chaperone
MTDYYQILGVPTDTEPNKIKQAYRELAFKYHPDRNTETPEVVEKMKQINEAYAVLSNAQMGGPYAFYHSKRSKKLVVTIPPGVRDGQKIRLTGMGERGKGAGASGDLYLKVHIKTPLLARIKKLIS